MENQNIGSARSLKNARIYLLSIFASYDDNTWTEKEKKRFIKKQQEAFDWIYQESLRYGNTVKFKQDFFYSDTIDFRLNRILPTARKKLNSESDNLNKEVFRALKSKGFNRVGDFFSDIKNKYNSTDVLVLLYVKEKGVSFARPFFSTSPNSRFLEVALVYNKSNRNNETSSSVIAHEILHLFGAWDLYEVIPEDKRRVKLVKKNFPNSIFLNSRKNISNNVLDEITAWRIGLADIKKWYLKYIPKNKFLKR